MDTTARTIVDVVISQSLLPEVVNIVHPHPVTWNSIFNTVGSIAGANGQAIPVIPFDTWLAKVEARAPNATAKDFEQIVSYYFTTNTLVIDVMRFVACFETYSIFP